MVQLNPLRPHVAQASCLTVVVRLGTSVIDQLSDDLQTAFPESKGFSSRNLRDMKRLFSSYADPVIWRPLVAKLEGFEIQKGHSAACFGSSLRTQSIDPQQADRSIRAVLLSLRYDPMWLDSPRSFEPDQGGRLALGVADRMSALQFLRRAFRAAWNAGINDDVRRGRERGRARVLPWSPRARR